MTDEQMLCEGREAGLKLVNSFHGDLNALAAELNRLTREQARPLFTPAKPATDQDDHTRNRLPTP